MTDQVFLDGKITLKGGDCLEVLKSLPDCSIDSCVTDPPYHLTSIVKRFGGTNASPAKFGTDGAYARASKGFMSKTWDGGDIAFRVELWSEVWRVLKPGGWLAAFSATRTYHRMAVAIEDSGFEIRDDILNMVSMDSVASRFVDSLSEAQAEAFFKLMEESQFGGMTGWCYGSGFPKSHDVAKSIDKSAGHWRGKAGAITIESQVAKGTEYERTDKGDPITDAARQWQGWGTALKPAWEPICLARKPLTGTVAANVLAYGTGALNIDGCRIDGEDKTSPKTRAYSKGQFGGTEGKGVEGMVVTEVVHKDGRWPANIVHDGSDEVLAGFPETTPSTKGVRDPNGSMGYHGGASGLPGVVSGHSDSGSAARFFYTAKADKLDRIGSKHPTVKPVDLMQWLCRLVTPPGGVVLDPFAGSGSTGEAAWREGFRCVLIEREEEYQADIAARLELADKGPATRKARAIKQAPDAGPLFGGAANDNGGGRQIYGKFADQLPGYKHNGGGGTESTRANGVSATTDGGIMAGKGGFGFRIREMANREK